MNRMLLDPASVEALEEWKKYNPGYVLAARPYFSKYEIHVKLDQNKLYVFYVDHKTNRIRITVKIAGKIKKTLAVIFAKRAEGHIQDYQIKCSSREAGDVPSDFITSVVDLVTTSNAVLTYGNVVEQNTVRLQGHNEGKDKIIVFRTFEGKVYALSTGTHRSPEGIFSVRGHFRKYKSGKIVWIDEYLKGVEKNEADV